MAQVADFDVLIVGGGMVGASLACALGDGRLRVAVVEAVPLGADSQPSYDERCVALAYGTRLIFEAMGLWRALAATATPIERIHVSGRGHFGAVRMDAASQGLEALGYVVENRCLGRVFGERVVALEHVELLCPARLKVLELESAAATAVIETATGERTVRARLVVGADGGRSTVRELAGIGSLRRDYAQSAIVANVSPGRPHDSTAYERFTDEGPVALLPLSEGRCALVWAVAAARTDELLAFSDAEFLVRLQKRFGMRLGSLRQVGRRSAYPLALVRAARSVATRLVLLGNAAHTLHPIAGQGFNLGLRDVAALAEVLAEAAKLGRDPGAPAVLSEYERWRRGDQRCITGLTDGLVRVFGADLPLSAWARSAGLVAVDLLPPLKRALMRRTMGLAGRLPRLARGVPLCRG